jgi:hypothetical protein
MMMLAAVLVAGLAGQASAAPAAPVVLPPASQIAAAVQAAPEDRRANDIVCLADDPKEAAFSVACYHKDLEAFMARGRELLAKGIKSKEREETRWKEIESGAIKMPREPRTLHVLSGSGFDPATGTIADAYLRWVIYTPFATPESTGLPIRPVPGGPWLMFPGTPTAHIMINPAKVAK